jgi:uncharacterized membrane protein
MNNAAHFHLMINHFPIILPFVGLITLILAIFLKSDIVKRVSYGIFVFAAISTLFAMNSGEGAEEVVEELGRNHRLIHEHEEHAETFAILAYLLGLFSIVALWLNWKKHPFANLAMYVTILVCAGTLYFAKSTGTSGGEITHKEVR